MTYLDVEFTQLLHAAEQLSAERSLVFTYDQHGWRVHPAAIYDPFEKSPLADDEPARADRSHKRGWPDEWLKPCGTRAAYQRHKTRGEKPCEPCVLANRDYERDKKRELYARRRRQQTAGQSPLVNVIDCTTVADEPAAEIYHLPVTGTAS